MELKCIVSVLPSLRTRKSAFAEFGSLFILENCGLCLLTKHLQGAPLSVPPDAAVYRASRQPQEDMELSQNNRRTSLFRFLDRSRNVGCGSDLNFPFPKLSIALF